MAERLHPPEDVVRRLRDITSTLPESHEEDAWTGVRWRIRGRTFAHVMVSERGYASAYRDATGDESEQTVLTFRASGDELLALTHAGLPFYSLDWSQNAVGMVLDADTDWVEVAELVTESYRCCAPQRLVRRLDGPAEP